jgi:hypothetical protein
VLCCFTDCNSALSAFALFAVAPSAAPVSTNPNAKNDIMTPFTKFVFLCFSRILAIVLPAGSTITLPKASLLCCSLILKSSIYFFSFYNITIICRFPKNIHSKKKGGFPLAPFGSLFMDVADVVGKADMAAGKAGMVVDRVLADKEFRPELRFRVFPCGSIVRKDKDKGVGIHDGNHGRINSQ